MAIPLSVTNVKYHGSKAAKYVPKPSILPSLLISPTQLDPVRALSGVLSW